MRNEKWKKEGFYLKFGNLFFLLPRFKLGNRKVRSFNKATYFYLFYNYY